MGKEGDFGLPEDLFNSMLTFLQGVAGGSMGTDAAGHALSALVSLAKEEHAAAASRFNPSDAMDKVTELQKDLDNLKDAKTDGLNDALDVLAENLDEMATVWDGGEP